MAQKMESRRNAEHVTVVTIGLMLVLTVLFTGFASAAPADPSTTYTSVTLVEDTTDAGSAATSSAETQRRLRELEILSTRVSEKQREAFAVVDELDVMDEELGRLVEEHNRRSLELEQTKDKVETRQRQLDALHAELLASPASLEQRVVGAYKNEISPLEVILNTRDMQDFVKRVRYLVTVARADRQSVRRVESLQERVNRLLENMSRYMHQVSVASRRLEEQRAEVEERMAARQAYLDQLTVDIKTLVEEQRALAGAVVSPELDLSAFSAERSEGIVGTALQYLGVPYVWGGASPSGFDCSGLVQYVFRQHGTRLPHYSRYQFLMGVRVPRSEARPSDLVFFGDPVYHVGIYMGDGYFIHAPRTGDVVKVSLLSGRSDLRGIKRIPLSIE